VLYARAGTDIGAIRKAFQSGPITAVSISNACMIAVVGCLITFPLVLSRRQLRA
jgi:hypothetical protein